MRYEKKIILILVVSTFLTIGLFVFNSLSKDEFISEVVKPEPGKDGKNIELYVYEEDQLLTEYQGTIQARELPIEDIQRIFDEKYDELLEIIKGDNESLEKVTKNLVFPEKSTDGVISYSWFTEDINLINYNGIVSNLNLKEDEKKNITIRLVMSYLDFRCEYELYVVVCGPDLEDRDTYKQLIARRIDEEINDKSDKDRIILPENINGMKLTYKLKKDKMSPEIIIILGILASLVVFIGEKEKYKTDERNRKQELTYSYSEVVGKLALLIRAGMTTRMAWEKIVNDYVKKRREGTVGETVVYEEMLKAKNNMDNGISEAIAYEQFGKRCNTREYKKMVSLLESNLKKGSERLLLLLEDEVQNAFENRLAIAKRKGEEATTKLLIPMIMMLAVVLAIIMIPAVLSFNI